MKINYILDYTSKETGKGVRANLGYNINYVKAAVYEHLKKGDFNVVVMPILEDCSKDDPDNIDILDVDVNVILDEIPEQKEPAKPN